MSAPTFLQVLKAEVARMQTLHPERLGEISRACALILHGQVLPSADDPQTGMVLSSDGETRYTVNGSCDCQAGQHGKPCKHLQSWRLYQYISKKVEAAPVGPLPEAPASVNCHITIAGRQVQLTLRDTDEGRLLARLAQVLAQYPLPQPPAQSTNPRSPQQHNARAQHQPVTQTGWCAVHNVAMRWNEGKDGRKGWFSHRDQDDGAWCKGRK